MCTKERWIKDELRLHIKFGLIFGLERSVNKRPFVGLSCLKQVKSRAVTMLQARVAFCKCLCHPIEFAKAYCISSPPKLCLRLQMWPVAKKSVTARHESGQEPWTRPAKNTNGYIYTRTHAVLSMHVTTSNIYIYIYIHRYSYCITCAYTEVWGLIMCPMSEVICKLLKWCEMISFILTLTEGFECWFDWHLKIALQFWWRI